MKYTKDVALHSSWDVIVCGAGPSGIAAAVTASRLGMKVMLLERYGAVGGCLTLGNVTTVMGGVAGGTIRDEMARMLASPNGETGIDCDAAKGLLTDLLAREKVEFRLQCPVVDACVADGEIRGVFALTQKGIVLMEAKRVIDATGDGYVAAAAGCEVMTGRDGDGLVQPSSLMYTIDGMNEGSDLVCRHEEDRTVFPDGREYLAMCEKAAAEGRLPANVTIVRLYKTGRKGERLVNATQMNGVSILRDGDAEKSEIELRRQMETVNRFLREEVPGCENIRVRSSASTLGVRESRRIRGRYVLEAEDLLAGRVFEDAVVHRADFCIDIHNPTGGGQAETEGCPPRTQPYDIPMRALQPLQVDNLVLSGRSISGSHRAHASYRVMNIAMAIGQASGTMAAVSIRNGCRISELDYRDVQKSLEEQGCRLRD
ncbi:MAG: FAD-dependent oxidoreductase [Clostridia bacterium]|nr:FAD-dependent oxidoreductase [Clostridia bacterium]